MLTARGTGDGFFVPAHPMMEQAPCSKSPSPARPVPSALSCRQNPNTPQATVREEGPRAERRLSGGGAPEEPKARKRGHPMRDNTLRPRCHIADVSGKGIPGALFMMAAKAELENFLSTGMEPAEAIAATNRALCANNDAGMFVTVWAATLDWQTGIVTYVNAGHNFPLLRRGRGGDWEWLKKRCGLFLGTFETAKYRQETLQLQPGNELVLYTDGVNEAFDVQEREYGDDRLEEFLCAHADLHPRRLARALRGSVFEWARGAEQSDDVTILVLEYGVAPEKTESLESPATLDHLAAATALVTEELERMECPSVVRHEIVIALEELFVNVCNYAYAHDDTPGRVLVRYSSSRNPSSMSVELQDSGVPFNPLHRADPPRPTSIKETRIGGLGIHMVKRTMDEFTYTRNGTTNIVTFGKSW